MLGYLFYDHKDIQRNHSFIDWMIDEAEQLNMTLQLVSSSDYHSKIMPDFVINRSRFSSISQYYNSHQIPTFNSYEVTEITNDKYKTYQFFKDITPMLDTQLYPMGITFPYVIKHRFGHGGTDVHLIENQNQILEHFNSDYIVQPLSPIIGKDLRVYVIGNEIVEAILRTSNGGFKSNYSLGGHIAVYTLNTEEKKTIQHILNHMLLDYAGIDFLFDENHKLILNEIEDAVGARMLSELTDHNIVRLYLKHISKKIRTSLNSN